MEIRPIEGADEYPARAALNEIAGGPTTDIDFRIVAEKSLSLIVVTDRVGIIQWVNPMFCWWTGFAADEVVGRGIADLGQLEPQAVAELWDTLAFGRPWRGELAAKTRDGRSFWFQSSISPVTDRAGQVTHFIAVGLEISDRKRAEDALRESEERFRKLAETTTAATLIFDGPFIRYANDAAAEISGYTIEELVGKNFWELAHPLLQEITAGNIRGIPPGGQMPARSEVAILTKGGQTRWLDLSTGFVELDGRRLVLGTGFDVTARKQAEQELKDSEEKFRTLVDTLPAAAFIFQGTRLRYANRTCYDVLGYSEEDLATLNFWDVLHPDYRDLVRERGIARLRGEDVPDSYEVRFLKKSGESRWGFYSGALVSYEGKPAVLGIVYDITERKVAEQAVIDSEEKFRTLVDTMPAAVIIFQDGKVRYANQVAFDVFGHSPEDLTKVDFWEFVHSDYRDLIRARGDARLRGEDVPSSYEIRFTRKDGEQRWGLYLSALITYEGRPALIGSLYDITERKAAEEALSRSEERYRILYHDNPTMYFTLSADLTILSTNQYGADLLGYLGAELMGRPVSLFVHPEDQALIRRELLSLVRHGGAKHDIEFRKVRKDGGIIWVRESVGVTQDVDGTDILLVVCDDITEQKRIEAELQARREDIETKAERAIVSRVSPYNLSFRELTVLDLVTGGRSDKEIATILGISPQTVSKHVTNLLRKMQASSRTEAGVRALREGLVT